MPRSKTKPCCPVTDAKVRLPPGKGKSGDVELAVLAKAVGHPVRVQILRILSKGTCICGELVDELPVAQATVSQHLKVLKKAGLIRGDIEGSSTCYCLEPRGVRRLKTLMNSL